MSKRQLDEELRERLKVFPKPGSKFDPLHATAAELAEHGFPPTPDGSVEPDALAFWRLMLSPPLEYVVPQFEPETPERPRFILRHLRQAVPIVRGRTRCEGSRNWSGIYITPKRPGFFTKVTGSWRVPAISLPRSQATGPAPINGEYRSSTWVGVGGHRPLPHASMPQIGTSQFLRADDGAVTTGAWWQWWENNPNCPPPIRITNLPVAIGDQIFASVSILTGDHAHFHMKNQSSGRFVTFCVAPSNNVARPAHFSSTAEWIVERPTELGSTNLYPLPRYADVVFEHCLADSVPATGGPVVHQRIRDARRVRMYERHMTPYRKAYISIPEKPVGNSARVFYRDAPHETSSARTMMTAPAAVGTTSRASSSRRSALYAVLLLAVFVAGITTIVVTGGFEHMLQQFTHLIAR
jgi:Peptidase A4 family